MIRETGAVFFLFAGFFNQVIGQSSTSTTLLETLQTEVSQENDVVQTTLNNFLTDTTVTSDYVSATEKETSTNKLETEVMTFKSTLSNISSFESSTTREVDEHNSTLTQNKTTTEFNFEGRSLPDSTQFKDITFGATKLTHTYEIITDEPTTKYSEHETNFESVSYSMTSEIPSSRQTIEIRKNEENTGSSEIGFSTTDDFMETKSDLFKSKNVIKNIPKLESNRTEDENDSKVNGDAAKGSENENTTFSVFSPIRTSAGSTTSALNDEVKSVTEDEFRDSNRQELNSNFETNYNRLIITDDDAYAYESSKPNEMMNDETVLNTKSPFFEMNTEKEKFDKSNNQQTPTTSDIDSERASSNPVMVLDDSSEITDADLNVTRVPKRIQANEANYPEVIHRPARPDPGYAHHQDGEIARPYRPDLHSHERTYFRPTTDFRVPVRNDKDYIRSSRPDSDYQRSPYRPDYGYSKSPSSDEHSSSKQPVSESEFSRPYRPAFSRPYRPQSAFSRPYHPNYHRPQSPDNRHPYLKPAEDLRVTSPHDEYSSISQSDDYHGISAADFDYTRSSEVEPQYEKPIKTDVKPTGVKTNIYHSIKSPVTDLRKPLQPAYDSTVLEETLNAPNSPVVDSVPSRPFYGEKTYPIPLSSEDSTPKENSESLKPAHIEGMDANKKTESYPRPDFGSNYGQKSGTSPRPFSAGPIMSSRNLTRVEFIRADCFDNHMKVAVRFNGTFEGLIYSSGYAQDSSCSYINGSGRNQYEFFIRLNRCGTLGQQEVADHKLALARRRQERAQYLVNTVTVQYNPMIEEDIDEHFRVTCEYGYDFWKTVTFPVTHVESSALKVRTGNPVVFTLPPPRCTMEIRSGYGPSGNRVSGPVSVGDPLTLVIHMKSESSGFDILVSNCVAHNGAQKRLQIIDSNGCVVQEKLVSPFRGVSSPDRTQQVTLYSYLKAFRFTGSPALYIECDVHMCHGSCPPQRCYWRHLYKRSLTNASSSVNEESQSVVSESISLFQSLEVRHDEADISDSIAIKRTGRRLNIDDADVCMRTGAFATVIASLLLLILIPCVFSVCLCVRLRRMKTFVDNTDTKRCVNFSGRTVLK